MKYYLDENLSPKIAEILKKHKIDALSVCEAGMIQASDREQLEYASVRERCLVTRNRDDFLALTIQFFNENRKHCGILIVPHTLPGYNFSRIAKLIAKHTVKHPAGMASYAIDFLES